MTEKKRKRLLRSRMKHIRKTNGFLKEIEFVLCLTNLESDIYKKLKSTKIESIEIGSFFFGTVKKKAINKGFVYGLVKYSFPKNFSKNIKLKFIVRYPQIIKSHSVLNLGYSKIIRRPYPTLIKANTRLARSSKKTLIKVFLGLIKLENRFDRSTQTRLIKVNLEELAQKELEEKYEKIKHSRSYKKIQKIQNTDNYKKTSAIKKMRVALILLVLGIFTGSGLGLWYYNNLLRSNIDWESLYERSSEFEANYNDIFSSTLGITSEQDKENFVQIAKAKSLTPDKLSVADNIALCEYHASLANSYSIVGVGEVLTLGIKQAVYSDRRFDGNKYEFVNISSGLISVASLDARTKGANSVEIYSGSNVKSDSATWTYASSMEINDYKNLAGNVPGVIHPYIISAKTIKSSTPIEYDKQNKTYTFTITLDETLSTIRYVRQVKKSGGLGSYPTFSSVVQKITIDSNWNFVSIDITEKYTAIAYGLPTTCNGSLLNEFTFNQSVKSYT